MPLPLSYLDANGSRPLDNDEARLLMAFLHMVRERGDGVVPSGELEAAIRSIDPALAANFFISVMSKRMAFARPDLSFSVPLVIWCAHLSDRVGVAVHWAYTMMDFDRRNGKPMTISDWCEAFPYGPPTEEEMHRLWDAQKGRLSSGSDSDTDNLLDGREAWAALHAELR